MYARKIVQGMLHNLLSLSSNLQTHPNLFLSNWSQTIWEPNYLGNATKQLPGIVVAPKDQDSLPQVPTLLSSSMA